MSVALPRTSASNRRKSDRTAPTVPAKTPELGYSHSPPAERRRSSSHTPSAGNFSVELVAEAAPLPVPVPPLLLLLPPLLLLLLRLLAKVALAANGALSAVLPGARRPQPRKDHRATSKLRLSMYHMLTPRGRFLPLTSQGSGHGQQECSASITTAPWLGWAAARATPSKAAAKAESGRCTTTSNASTKRSRSSSANPSRASSSGRSSSEPTNQSFLSLPGSVPLMARRVSFHLGPGASGVRRPERPRTCSGAPSLKWATDAASACR